MFTDREFEKYSMKKAWFSNDVHNDTTLEKSYYPHRCTVR